MRSIVKIICFPTSLLILLLVAGNFLWPPGTIAKAGKSPPSQSRAENGASLADSSSFEVFLNGVPLGNINLETKKEGEAFLLQGSVTLRPLGDLFKIDYRASALTSADPVRPSEAVIEQEQGDRKKTFRFNFLRPDHATGVQIEEKPGKKPSSLPLEFQAGNFILDPLSTVLLLRHQSWQAGKVQSFNILTGKKQYELQLTCLGESVLIVDGRPRPVWQIGIQSRMLEPPWKVKLKGYFIYLSKDPEREILRVTGKYMLGDVVAQLGKPREPRGQ